MRRNLTAPIALAAAVFTLANGWIHLREWLQVYRDLPAQVPGVEVVQVGFPVNAALAVAAAVALLVAVVRFPSKLRLVAIGVAVFNAGSLAALVISRTGSLFGWQEPVWNPAANQTLAVEIGALVTLAAVVVIDELRRRTVAPATAWTTDAPSRGRGEPVAA